MNPLEKEVTISCDDKIFNTGNGHVIHLSMSNHVVELKYAGEPPHGDFYYDMYIDGNRIKGYVWAWTIAFPFKQKYIVCNWMSKLYERKTIIIDIEKLKFFEIKGHWTIIDVTEDQVTFSGYEKYEDQNSEFITFGASEDDFTEWLDEAVYPKKYIDELENEAKNAKDRIAKGKHKVFSSTEEIFEDLGK
ncbi:MAG: hypothetical protein JXN65_07145 [Clostridia bacterium]|nr:hypothetical protein [Clostridia bacterium]